MIHRDIFEWDDDEIYGGERDEFIREYILDEMNGAIAELDLSAKTILELHKLTDKIIVHLNTYMRKEE